jgi:hypothetical protein
MATRNSGYSVGAIPPQVTWTVVRGDTAAFKIYLTDDAQAPIYIPDWTIDMEIKRPTDAANAGVITDAATLILTLVPAQDADDLPGEFTVSLSAADSALLETGDIFDVELSTAQNEKVWTVAQGKIVLVEDVTN